MDDLEGLSPEMIQQLMELGVIDDQKSDTDKQLAMANSMRNGTLPQGRDSGRVYTAAHPLEMAVAAYKGYKGGKDAQAAQKKQEALLQKQLALRQQYVGAMLQRGQQRDGAYGVPMGDEGVL